MFGEHDYDDEDMEQEVKNFYKEQEAKRKGIKRKPEAEPEEDSEESEDEKGPKRHKGGGQTYWFMITIGINKLAGQSDLQAFKLLHGYFATWLHEMNLDCDHWQAVLECTWRTDSFHYSEHTDCDDKEACDKVWATNWGDKTEFWYQGTLTTSTQMWQGKAYPADWSEERKAEETKMLAALMTHLGEARFKNYHYHLTVHLKNKRTKPAVIALWREKLDERFPSRKCYLHVGGVSPAGQAAARKYIYKKGDTYVAGPWNNQSNKLPEEGDLTLADLPKKVLPWWKLPIQQLASGYPPKEACRLINIFEDSEGNKMKSWFMKSMLMRYPEHVGVVKGVTDQKDLQTKIMTQIKASGNKRMWIVDIPRTQATRAALSAINREIENIKDGFYQQDKYKSDMKLAKQPWLWILCNDNSGVGKEKKKVVSFNEEGEEEEKEEWVPCWSKDRAVYWSAAADTGDFHQACYDAYNSALQRARDKLASDDAIMEDFEWPAIASQNSSERS